MTLCVVFDFDGVLVDSNAVKRQAYFDIFSPLGLRTVPTVEAVLDGDVDGDRFQLIRRILVRLREDDAHHLAGTLDSLVTQYAERYNDVCEEHAATCPEIPGASTALARLAVSHPLYVSSATPEDPLRRIVERRGWSRFFRDVLGRPRSKAENLRVIMKREGVDGGAVVVVGDGRRDLDAARMVGARFVGVRNTFNDFEPGALLLIDDLLDLSELIESARVPSPLAAGS
jgi:phosphoglycolate phosphatase